MNCGSNSENKAISALCQSFQGYETGRAGQTKKGQRHTNHKREQMQYPDRDTDRCKSSPKACIFDRSWKQYYQYTAIDEYSRLRYLEGFQTADTFLRLSLLNTLLPGSNAEELMLNVCKPIMELNSPNAS